MARKAKRRVPKMPPLSALDRFIYWVLLLLGICLCFGSVLGVFFLRDRIAFSDPAVAASWAHASIMCFLPLFLYVCIAVIYLFEKYCHLDRYPLFGIKGFRYGPPAYPKIYPLFMKNKPYVWRSERAIQQRKEIAIILLILLGICVLLWPLSLSGRDTVLEDGRIIEYNALGVAVREYDQQNMESVELGFRRERRKYNLPSYYPDIQFTTEDGRSYYFSHMSFRDKDTSDMRSWILDMLKLKEIYRNILSYDDLEYLDHIIRSGNYSKAELDLLLQLYNTAQ